jgi:oligopeptide transport system substrate-binding protein
VAETAKPVVNKSEALEKEYERAKELLAEAGFPGGQNFPKVRLLINRNEQQKVVAQSIAAMWRAVLNIDTEIIIKNWDDYEVAIRSGDYDVVRRGIVMQTTDELTNMRLLFEEGVAPDKSAAAPESKSAIDITKGKAATNDKNVRTRESFETEAQALKNLSAMPIYFASSYSLVRPYVAGFDANVLDAPSLKSVHINTGWKQSEKTPVSWVR